MRRREGKSIAGEGGDQDGGRGGGEGRRGEGRSSTGPDRGRRSARELIAVTVHAALALLLLALALALALALGVVAVGAHPLVLHGAQLRLPKGGLLVELRLADPLELVTDRTAQELLMRLARRVVRGACHGHLHRRQSACTALGLRNL